MLTCNNEVLRMLKPQMYEAALGWVLINLFCGHESWQESSPQRRSLV